MNPHDRHALTDAQWDRLAPQLPPQRARTTIIERTSNRLKRFRRLASSYLAMVTIAMMLDRNHFRMYCQWDLRPACAEQLQ